MAFAFWSEKFQLARWHPRVLKELVSGGEDTRNWKGIGIAFLVILGVCVLIICAILFLSPGSDQSIKKPPIEQSEIFDGTFNSHSFDDTWVSDSEILRQQDGALVLYNIPSNTTLEIIPANIIRQNDFTKYTLSADRKYVLCEEMIKAIFRHSYLATFKLWNIKDQLLTDFLPEDPFKDPLQYAEWGPSGSQMVLVYKNDIYYVPGIENGKVQPVRLSYSGVEGVIYNGVPDWLYEEEIIAGNKVLWWSKSGARLAFLALNDTQVDEMTFPKYGDYLDPGNINPEMVHIRYSKPGRPNPTVELWVVDIQNITNLTMSKVTPPSEISLGDYYFISTSWVDNSQMLVTWATRAQNHSIISLCSVHNFWSCSSNLEQMTNRRGWIHQPDPPVISPDGANYYTTLPVSEGEEGHFIHVIKVNIGSKKKSFLTSGKYDVRKIVAVDPKLDRVYFLSTSEGRPGESILWSYDERDKLKQVTPRLEGECTYYSVSFSRSANYYVENCQGPGIPRSLLKEALNGTTLEVLYDNSRLRKELENRAMPTIKTLRVPLQSSYEAIVMMVLPPGFKEDEKAKYPVLLNVYAGPGSQMVSDKFSINWGTYLASKKQVIYVKIDGRGSGFRGERIMHELYRRFGTVEVEDQIEAMRYLANRFPYIDRERIAIWGWSYGGYVTTMALEKSKLFKCGMAVAPVTNWHFYDSAYTERYMQMPSPDDNYVGYEKSSALANSDDIGDKRYFLIHGTLDDNVHFQQSMMLTKALVFNNVLFRTQVYPDENHSLNTVTTHLYNNLRDFLTLCLNLPPSESSAGLKSGKFSS